MSTQDNPPSGQDDRQFGTPPGSTGGTSPSGQQGPWQQNGGRTGYGQMGQPGHAGQYGYQAAQPYAYPGGGAGPRPVEKGPAPVEVVRAYYLIVAAGALSLVASIISALTTEVPDIAGASVGVGLGIVFAALFAAVYVVLAVFIRKGHNWARITATVLAALNVMSVLSSFLLMPLVGRAAELSDQPLATPSELSLALAVIVMLLGVAGVVLTYLRPSRPYFAPRRLGY
ncbi:hypothetical protein ACX80I_13185 [Arthrobacter sp. MDT3-44]